MVKRCLRLSSIFWFFLLGGRKRRDKLGVVIAKNFDENRTCNFWLLVSIVDRHVYEFLLLRVTFKFLNQLKKIVLTYKTFVAEVHDSEHKVEVAWDLEPRLSFCYLQKYVVNCLEIIIHVYRKSLFE